MIIFSTRWDQKLNYSDYLRIRVGWKKWVKENVEEGKYHFGDFTIAFEDKEDATVFKLIIGNDILTDTTELP